MTNLVPRTDIEGHVGVPRHHALHFGRVVTATGQFYIMHSQECLNSGIDLRDCQYSQALDHGIDENEWYGWENLPVTLLLHDNELLPAGVYLATL